VNECKPLADGGGGGVCAMLAACLRAPPPLQGLFAIMNFPRTMPETAADTDTALALLQGRGLHSFALQLNLSTFGTPSWVKLGRLADKIEKMS
jgi:hypothetical protein